MVCGGAQALALDSLATWLTEDARVQPKLAHRDILTRITALLAMHSPARAPHLSCPTTSLIALMLTLLCAVIAMGGKESRGRVRPDQEQRCIPQEDTASQHTCLLKCLGPPVSSGT